MRLKIFISFLILCSCLACNREKSEKTDSLDQKLTTEISFDKTKWRVKEGSNYPYRDQMLHDIVYNDTVRTLNKQKILELLGEPDKINEGYLYYRITQTRLGTWPLHTKTMVIKLSDDNSIEWIKIHK